MKSMDMGDNVKILVAPPEYYPGNAGTFILQGPNKEEVHEKLKILEHACLEMGMKEFEIVDDRPDPNGGWKCLILSHNFNPVTWASEKFHRASLGAREGWETGRKKAALKHRVGVKSEIARAPYEELAGQKRRTARLAGQHAAINAAARVHVQGEAALAAARETAKYNQAIAEVNVPPAPVKPAPIYQPVDMNAAIFS